MKTVLITGATAGIGEACAVSFAKEGFRLILTGRREERLEALKKRLEQEFEAEVLVRRLDVRQKAEVENTIRELPAAFAAIDVLINNAGLALGLAPIDEGDTADWDTMIDTNLKGLLYVTRAVVPGMKQRRSGHVLNIGSTAGKEVYRNGNVYAATKHAVDALTKSMRIDLLPHDIRVTGVCPGMSDTEFSQVRFKGDTERAAKVYLGMEPLHAQDIAEVILFAATRPPHVCLNDIVLTPTAQANSFYVERHPL